MVNNGDWLLNLNYIDFLREVGALFSVNRMLTAECYKRRHGNGPDLPGIQLHADAELRLPAAVPEATAAACRSAATTSGATCSPAPTLIRRKEQQDAFALTCKLIMTHDGKKMGKTEKGALWLDPARTSPYDFYQYWRNVG